MAIHRHPDGTFHRFPYRELPAVLIPIKGRPGWFTDRDGKTVYVEPPKKETP